MIMNQRRKMTEFERTLRELSASRGISLEEVVDELNEQGHRFTVKQLLEAPGCGYGNPLDKVLGFNEDERVRISHAFRNTFMSAARES